MENSHTVGRYFRDKLEELQEKHDLIGDVRGMGLMQAIELGKNARPKSPRRKRPPSYGSRKRGLLIGKGGLFGNVIRMSPPMNIAKADVDEAIRIMDQAFTAMSSPADGWGGEQELSQELPEKSPKPYK